MNNSALSVPQPKNLGSSNPYTNIQHGRPHQPDLSDLDPETQQYIHQLQDQVQFLDQELQKSEQEKLELVQEMEDAVEDYDHLLKRIRGIEEVVKEQNRQRQQALKTVKEVNNRLEEALDTPEDMERKTRESEEMIEYLDNADPIVPEERLNKDSDEDP